MLGYFEYQLFYSLLPKIVILLAKYLVNDWMNFNETFRKYSLDAHLQLINSLK